MSDIPDTVRWLHLSDFHFKSGDGYDRDVVLRALLSSLPRLTQRAGPIDLIIASGDIAFSGRDDEYANASIFFDQLLKRVGLSRKELLVVPGNHDVNRLNGKGLARSLATREDADLYFNPSEPLPHILKRQQGFSRWYNTYFEGIREFSTNSSCSAVEVINIKGLRLAVLPINSAIFSFDDADFGKLWIGRRSVEVASEQLASTAADVRITVMHHPFSWLSSIEHQNVRETVRKSSDCILTGHLHDTDAEVVAGLSGHTMHLAAGATYQTRNWPNRALIVTASQTSFTVLPIRYEDKPTEVWTVDTSIFTEASDFTREFSRQTFGAVSSPSPNLVGNVSPSVNISSAASVAAETELEQELFKTPTGLPLYAEPRLMSRPQGMAFDADQPAQQIGLEEVISSGKSYLIVTKPESGGTTLSKRLLAEILKKGISEAARKDARNLPAYRKKLEGEFSIDIRKPEAEAVLILDHVDLERDERLLRELASTAWFTRVIAITVDRDLRPTKPIESKSLPFEFEDIYLWNMSRPDVRTMACLMFDTVDAPLISQVVDKVYADLLGLCIPLTPVNVIMYLRILQREGEFNPLNRVDILSRYLSEVLRKPSDAYRDSFNLRNKMDVLSSLVYELSIEETNGFDDRYWYAFHATYKDNTLSEYDDRSFLNELLESRVLVRLGSRIHFRYSFYFDFFLGRHIASKKELLEKFISDGDYYRGNGIIDVITGLSTDNTILVSALCEQLESLLEQFSGKYLPIEFDPMSSAVWPDSKTDDEALWKPITDQIDSGPKTSGEIDVIKSSLLSEVRTADQEVTFARFVELEIALFHLSNLLEAAIRNSDDIGGNLKLRAVDALLRSHMVGYQVGFAFSPVIASRKYFRWGGVAFLDFNELVGDLDPNAVEAKVSVVDAISRSVSLKASEEIGVKKLGPVFRSREKQSTKTGFLELVNFACLLAARPQDWNQLLAKAIERTDKNSYYLFGMLMALLNYLRNEIGQSGDREKAKRLVALVRAKRDFNKQVPGPKAVNKMFEFLKKTNQFGEPEADKK